MRRLLSHLHRIRFIHFLIIGGLNTVFGYAVYVILIAFDWHYAFAVLVATVIGVVFNFFTTGRWVFQSRNNRLFGRFILVYAIVYAVNIALIKLFHSWGLNDYQAGASVIPLIAVLGFILNKIFVFSESIIKTNMTKEDLAKQLQAVDTNEPLGTALYNAIAKHSISISFEAALLRERNSKVEIFLKQRDKTDTAYPGEWHIPGSVFRSGEYPKDVALRVAQMEFALEKFTSMEFVEFFFVPTPRGWFHALVFLVKTETELSVLNGEWFSIDALPNKTVTFHKTKFIPAAANFYKPK